MCVVQGQPGHSWNAERQHIKSFPITFSKTTNQCMKSALVKGPDHTYCAKPKQVLILNAFSSIMPYESTSKKHKEFTDDITFHITKEIVLIYTITKEGFQKMVGMVEE